MPDIISGSRNWIPSLPWCATGLTIRARMRPYADLRSLPLTTEAFRWNTIILIKNKTPPTPPSNASLTRVGLQALYAETLMSYEEFNQMFAQFKEHYWKVSRVQQEKILQVFEDNNFRPRRSYPFPWRRSQRFSKETSFIPLQEYRMKSGGVNMWLFRCTTKWAERADREVEARLRRDIELLTQKYTLYTENRNWLQLWETETF